MGARALDEIEWTYSGMKKARSGSPPTSHCSANTVFQAEGSILGTKARTMPSETPCMTTVKNTRLCKTAPRKLIGAT